jgi:hypothetical protein
MQRFILTIFFLLLSAPSLANDWYSAAHFGFATEAKSSTGFEKTSGSLSFLDVGHRSFKNIDLGLRTLMQGGQSDGYEYYRMGSGPMVSWRPSKTWIIHSSYTFFRETGLSDSGEKEYRSEGRSLLLGYERVSKLAKSVEFVYGGFFSRHSGGVDVLAAVPSKDQARSQKLQKNEGLSHGVEVALRMFF